LKQLNKHILCTEITNKNISNNNDIGLFIALKKFQEFYELFTYAQYLFSLGKKQHHNVNTSNGDVELAQKDFRFFYLTHSILDYAACYDYILQIVYFGFDFFEDVNSVKDYRRNLENCKLKKIKERVKELDESSLLKAYIGSLGCFYKGKYKKNLTTWTNTIKHRGGFSINGLNDSYVNIECSNKSGESLFDSTYVEPLLTSFQDIIDCLEWHNDKLIEFAENLFKIITIDKDKYSINPQRMKKYNDFTIKIIGKRY